MAASLSSRRAQIPKPCELCETDTNIKWKCVQCNKIICEKCKNIHLKVQTPITHKIVEVKSSEAQQEMELKRTGNILCQIHKKKLNCMFCKTCDHLVCPECITASHEKHDLGSIDTVFNERREKLKELVSTFSEKFTLCEIEDSKAKDFKSKYEQFSAESDHKINQQEKLIINGVKKHAKTLRDQLGSEKQRMEKYITDKEKRMVAVKETLLNKQSNIKEVLESIQAEHVFDTFSELSKEEIPDVPFEAFYDETNDFIPTKGSLMNYTDLFGSLKKTKLPKGLPQVNLDVIKSYTTDFNIVDRVLILDEKTAWIYNDGKSSLHKINIDDKVTIIKDMSVKVYDISLTVNNDDLLSLYDSHDVSLLTTKTGEVKPFLSVSPLVSLSIHATKQNEIILGVRDSGGGDYNLTRKSSRKVIIFGMNGKQKQSYKYDKHKQRLFTIPARITSNVSNDILIIDRLSDDDGRVVVLNREGQVKWTYKGNPQVNKHDKEDKPFNPIDIVTTSVGHIILCEFDKHVLHVLSEQGDLLTYKVMKEQGITYPMSLDIDYNGTLWVGCRSWAGARSDAKLQVVKMSF